MAGVHLKDADMGVPPRLVGGQPIQYLALIVKGIVHIGAHLQYQAYINALVVVGRLHQVLNRRTRFRFTVGCHRYENGAGRVDRRTGQRRRAVRSVVVVVHHRISR